MKISRKKTSAKRSAQEPAPPQNGSLTQAGSITFPVVAIGASAGGLEALTKLLNALPSDTGMAFIIIQHLDPTHQSMLPQILGRATKMKVLEATQGAVLEPDHVFVIPPDTNLQVDRMQLRLVPWETAERPHLPVDHCLRSLAEAQGNRSIAIILSGTGADGSLGLEFVKAQGGIAFAQEPSSASFDGMPQAAIATGCVDFVLPPEKIARELAQICRNPYVRLAESSEPSALPTEETQLSVVFQVLCKYSGVDFAHYRLSTLRRRIQRRMALHGIETLERYLTLLKKNPEEVQGLYQDVLIRVTSFFRDPEVFAALKDSILPAILKQHAADAPLRIWVPGCSTGEEAYSIAMCLTEIGGLNLAPQIFASDISEDALAKARAGVYRENIAVDVSPERLRRFFTPLHAGGFQINKAVRDLCIFARQNVVRDPPFSKIDLISCRNLLIYIEPLVQKKILQTFHYALNSGGVLLLGNSETVGEPSELFALQDRKHRFFTRKATRPRISFEFSPVKDQLASPAPRPQGLATAPIPDIQRTADLAQLAKAPPSVVVDEELQILQFRGRTREFLEHPSGGASLSLLKMARPGLLLGLRSAIQQAKRKNRSIRKMGIEIEARHLHKFVDIEVAPLKMAGKTRLFLITFEKVAPPASRMNARTPRAKSSSRQPQALALENEQLRRELLATKEFLQASLNEQENTNQELKSSNEEVLSSNEELQSTNEELETAKEELQSANEELKTVNDELRTSLENTMQSHRYTETMVENISKALLVLDGGLRVKKANKAFYKIFRLESAETEDRPIFEIGSGQLGSTALGGILKKVVPDKTAIHDFEIEDDFKPIGRRTMLLDAHHIHWGPEQVDMVLLGIEDITERRRSEIALRESEKRLRLAVESTQLGLWEFNPETGVFFWTEHCKAILGLPSSATQHALLERVHPEDRGRVADLVKAALAPQGNARYEAEFRVNWPDGSIHWVAAHGQTFSDELAPGTRQMVGTARDITESKRRSEQEKLLAAEQAANRAKDDFIATLSHELRTPLTAISAWAKMMRSGRLDAASTAKGLEVIERNTNVQTQLIEDLLDVSRIVAGKLKVALRPTELKPAIEAALDAVRPAAEAKGLRLEALIDARSSWISGDPLRLQQIVWNVLVNAVKFTPRDGRVELRLELLRDDGRGRPSAKIQVRDTGIGIRPDFLPLIFERFRQADSSTASSYTGLGLGLAIVRCLVEQHHGSVSVESAGENKGTTFTIVVPTIDSPSAHTLKHVAVGTRIPNGPLERGRSLAGVRVLIVDDDRDTLDWLDVALRNAGGEVRTAAAAAEALNVLQSWQPQLLVSDIGLPDLDGYGLIRKIRQLPKASGGKIAAVALTAYARDDDRAQVCAAGFDGYLAKPVDPNLLVETLAKLVPVTVSQA